MQPAEFVSKLKVLTVLWNEGYRDQNTKGL